MSADDDSNLLLDLVIANLFNKIDDKDENAIVMARTKSEKPGGGKHPKQKKATSKEEGKRIAEENERRHQEKLRIRAEREKAQKAKKANITEDDARESFNIDAGGADESTPKKVPVPLILYVKSLPVWHILSELSSEAMSLDRHMETRLRGWKPARTSIRRIH